MNSLEVAYLEDRRLDKEQVWNTARVSLARVGHRTGVGHRAGRFSF